LHRILLLLAVLGLTSFSATAQDNFVESFGKKWQARASKTQAEQPKWAVPMFSPFPMVAQVFRLDYIRQRAAGAADTWNIDGGKGFNFIPAARTQVDVFIPGYMIHPNNFQDGFGDMLVLGKYRFFSAPEKEGQYSMSASLAVNIPTGSYKNGAASSSLTPSVIAGKGFGKLALWSSIGATLPTSGTETTGRTIHWNSVAQYKVGKYFTPELELNSNTWAGGTRDGKTQMFISPGVMSKFPLRPKDPTSRISLIFGFGFQTAVTSYYTYNHGVAVSTRFGF